MNSRHPMDQTPEQDLEKWIDAELRRLPECPAPDALLGQVLAQIHRRQTLPWWWQSLWHWPIWARNLALVLLASISLGVLGVGTGLWFYWDAPAVSITDWLPIRFEFWNEIQRLASGLAGLFGMENASSWLRGAGLLLAFVFVLAVGIGSVLMQITGLSPRFTHTKTS